MLQRIEITNFALIAELDLELGSGINVFTGETGAGKSILLDALSFLLGARANPGWIRSGCERMRVSGTFLLAGSERLWRIWRELALGDDDDENSGRDPEGFLQIQIWRELQHNGRSQARINGLPVTVSALRTLGTELLELQGQQETLQLIQPRQHLQILDQYGDSEHQRLYRDYRRIYEEWKAAEQRREQLLDGEREANRSEDLWRYQDEEISQAKLESGEDGRLEQRQQLLRGAERLMNSLNFALNAMSRDEDEQTSASTLLYQAKREMESAQRYDDHFSAWIEILDSLYWQIDELSHELSQYLSELEADPGEQEAIGERLELIRKLKRKYGATIPEILSYQKEIQQKLAALERHEEELHQAEEACLRLEKELRASGALLSASRQRVASLMEEAVMGHLAGLLMAECRFQVAFAPHQSEPAWRGNGLETCEFLIAPNPGEPLKPLARIASGGELARILLALKSALVALEMPDIMVFDEPDSGLSGAAVKAMAVSLGRLGRSCQLLLVTHQAAVAAVAKQHFIISKKVENEQTYTLVQLLDYEGRLQEMIRLLAADESSLAARRHAEELLQAASQFLVK